ARGLDPRERRAKALEALRLVGLEHRAHHRPAEMSGGEQQRVAIARAIVTEPKLILADEPTGNLDSANARAVMDLFKKLNKALGVTILLATHNLELLSYCDRAIRLVDGKVAGIYDRERYDELVALSSKQLREHDGA
ncbi:MAG: ABC transporter ATP-binding protein, partial [Thermoprotei archaeon]